jgi:hypothetical protein
MLITQIDFRCLSLRALDVRREAGTSPILGGTDIQRTKPSATGADTLPAAGFPMPAECPTLQLATATRASGPSLNESGSRHVATRRQNVGRGALARELPLVATRPIRREFAQKMVIRGPLGPNILSQVKGTPLGKQVRPRSRQARRLPHQTSEGGPSRHVHCQTRS